MFSTTVPPTSLRVLVVDDNRDAAATLAGLLILSGYHARYFLDGRAALEALPTFVPDVCLLDLRMPGLDGCELAAALRERLGEQVVLIAVTGELGDAIERRASDAGFDLWFSKPADPAVLLSTLAGIGLERAKH